MKKRLKYAAILMSLFFFTGCSQNITDSSCEHEYRKKDGVKVCSLCGDTENLTVKEWAGKYKVLASGNESTLKIESGDNWVKFTITTLAKENEIKSIVNDFEKNDPAPSGILTALCISADTISDINIDSSYSFSYNTSVYEEAKKSCGDNLKNYTVEYYAENLLMKTFENGEETYNYFTDKLNQYGYIPHYYTLNLHNSSEDNTNDSHNNSDNNVRTCQFEGCNKKATDFSREFCDTHSKGLNNYWDNQSAPKCKFDGCNNKVSGSSADFCKTHQISMNIIWDIENQNNK